MGKKQKYKLSYYIISVEEINEDNEVLMYSSRSGKKVILSRSVWSTIMDNKITFLPEDIMSHLIKLKILVNSHENELETILFENKEVSKKTDGGLLYEVIQPSAFCQMGCYYCGQYHIKQNVSQKNIEKIINRIQSKLLTNSYKELKIGWFGAEPLVGLLEIREITKELIHICNKSGINYTSKIVTNGLKLNEHLFLEMVNDLKMDRIEITIDGTEGNHDQHRFLKNGKGTFKRIYRNLKTIIETKKKYDLNVVISVRCNVDINNSNDVTSLIEKLHQDEILSKINFYPIGIYEWGDKQNKESLDKNIFGEKELHWFIDLLDNGYNISGALITVRKYNTCLTTKKNSEVYDSYGNVFNCTEIPYTKEFEKSEFLNGRLEKDIKNSKDNHLADWYEIIEKDNTLPCKSCKLLPVCGGGCPKSWKEGNVPCPTFKYNYKDRLRLFNFLRTYKGQKEELIKDLKVKFNYD